MKQLLIKCFSVFAIPVLFFSCTKEVSLESGIGTGLAEGTLTDSLGNCRNSLVMGEYLVNTPLNDSNLVTVNVTIATIGKYLIYSDTVNGMWFLDSGFAQSAGAAIITLKGKGQPLAMGTVDFKLKFGSSACGFSVTTGGPNNGSSSYDYLATKPNGWIRYGLNPSISIIGGSTLDSFRSTISPVSVTFNSKQYYTYETAPFNSIEFYTKGSNGEYWCVGSPQFDYLNLYDTIVNNTPLEYIYLKENVLPGTPSATWESTSIRAGRGAAPGTIFGQANLRFTVIAINESAVYMGITLQKIIRVKREMIFTPESGTGTGTPLILLEGEIRYARGIGLINQRIYEPGLPNTTLQSITIRGFSGL